MYGLVLYSIIFSIVVTKRQRMLFYEACDNIKSDIWYYIHTYTEDEGIWGLDSDINRSFCKVILKCTNTSENKYLWQNTVDH